MNKEFIAKLVDIQASLVARKDKVNDFAKFQYRTAEGILAAVKPHLQRHGLFMTITDEIVQIGESSVIESTSHSETPNKEGLVTIKDTSSKVVDARFYLKATATITDGENSVSASAMAREALDKKGSDSAQITGAASSYARKYCLNGLFGIDDSSNDPDAKSGSTKATVDTGLNARVDAALATAGTKVEAQAALGKLRIELTGTPSLEYASAQFKIKFP